VADINGVNGQLHLESLIFFDSEKQPTIENIFVKRATIQTW
jgi:hypothetical protein